MALRIGSWVLHPDLVFMPLAGAFFAIIAYRQLRLRGGLTPRDAWWIIVLACLGGIAGARVYGLVQPWQYGEPVLSSGAWKELRFGSLGWPWGAAMAAAAAAFIRRRSVLRVLDATVPGLCVCLMVARISCLFQGCCPGITVHTGLLSFQPFRIAWPVYDIVALALTLLVVLRYRDRCDEQRRDGFSLFIFLVFYGVLRFLLESVKDTFVLAGPFTWGHAVSVAGIVAGATWAICASLAPTGRSQAPRKAP